MTPAPQERPHILCPTGSHRPAAQVLLESPKRILGLQTLTRDPRQEHVPLLQRRLQLKWRILEKCFDTGRSRSLPLPPVQKQMIHSRNHSPALRANLDQINQKKNCYWIVYVNNILYNLIYSCDQSWIFSIMTPVFSVTWSFRNHYNMMICCSKNTYYYYQCWKQLYCLIFLWKPWNTFQESLMKSILIILMHLYRINVLPTLLITNCMM